MGIGKGGASSCFQKQREGGEEPIPILVRSNNDEGANGVPTETETNGTSLRGSLKEEKSY